MKVAITGTCGQLGALVLRRLLHDPRITEVRSIDLREPAVASTRLRSFQADVRGHELRRLFAGCDAVIHLAMLVTARASRADFESVNLHGSRNVFRCAREAGVRQILHGSSLAAYGVVPGHPVPLREHHPRRYQYDFAYAATAYEAEIFLDEFEAAHPDLHVTRLRPSILVGPRMRNLLGLVLAHRALLQIGGQAQAPIPLVWDEDVADAVLLCLQRPEAARGPFNLCADQLLTTPELCRRFDLNLITIPRPLFYNGLRVLPQLQRLGLVPDFDPAWLEAMSVTMVPDTARAHDVLGWRPSCPTAHDVLARYLGAVPRIPDRGLSRLIYLFASLPSLPTAEPPSSAQNT